MAYGAPRAGIALWALRAGLTLIALIALYAVDNGLLPVVRYLAVIKLHPAPLGEGLSVRADNQVAGGTGRLPDVSVRADLQHLVHVQPYILESGLVLRQQHRLFHAKRFQFREQALVKESLDFVVEELHIRADLILGELHCGEIRGVRPVFCVV